MPDIRNPVMLAQVALARRPVSRIDRRVRTISPPLAEGRLSSLVITTSLVTSTDTATEATPSCVPDQPLCCFSRFGERRSSITAKRSACGMAGCAIAICETPTPNATGLFEGGTIGHRTQMQWDGSSRAGFTTGQPWLPVSQNTSTIHVGQEACHALSFLTLHRWLIRLRQATASLVHGTYKPLGSTNPHCLVLVRKDERDAASEPNILVVVNFSSHGSSCSVPRVDRTGTVLVSTHEPVGDRRPWGPGRLDLQPDEAVIVSLS